MNSNNQILAEVLVFKTNIRYQKDIRKLGPILNSNRLIEKWNVDTKDLDNILRIESSTLKPEDIVVLINSAGYLCEELPD